MISMNLRIRVTNLMFDRFKDKVLDFFFMDLRIRVYIFHFPNIYRLGFRIHYSIDLRIRFMNLVFNKFKDESSRFSCLWI